MPHILSSSKLFRCSCAESDSAQQTAQRGWEGGDIRQKPAQWSHSVLPEHTSHAYTSTPVTALFPHEHGSYLIEAVKMVGELPCYLTVPYSLSVKQKYKWNAKTTNVWKSSRAHQSKQWGQQEKVLEKIELLKERKPWGKALKQTGGC